MKLTEEQKIMLFITVLELVIFAVSLWHGNTEAMLVTGVLSVVGVFCFFLTQHIDKRAGELHAKARRDQ